MLQWRVILLAGLAVMFLLGGLLALILPGRYEGPVLYRLDEQHAIRALDGVGLLLLVLGFVLALGAGATWQRRMHAS